MCGSPEKGRLGHLTLLAGRSKTCWENAARPCAGVREPLTSGIGGFGGGKNVTGVQKVACACALAGRGCRERSGERAERASRPRWCAPADGVVVSATVESCHRPATATATADPDLRKRSAGSGATENGTLEVGGSGGNGWRQLAARRDGRAGPLTAVGRVRPWGVEA